MAYDKTFYNRLRKDKDDAARAKAFDEAYPNFSEPQKAYCDKAIAALMTELGLSENAAKTNLAMALLFVHLKPDERDRWVARGRTICRAWEWAMKGKTHKEIAAELELEARVP